MSDNDPLNFDSLIDTSNMFPANLNFETIDLGMDTFLVKDELEFDDDYESYVNIDDFVDSEVDIKPDIDALNALLFPEISSATSTSSTSSQADNHFNPQESLLKNKRVLVCHKCKGPFHSEVDLKAHLLECKMPVSTNKRILLKCKLCDEIFSTETDLSNHFSWCKGIAKHSKKSKNPNSKNISKPLGLTSLKSEILKEKVKVPCNICHQEFKSRIGFTRHLPRCGLPPAPKKRKLPKCKHCGETFPTQNDREIHLLHCDEFLAQLQDLNVKRVRYGREEYKCGLCRYTCTVEAAYFTHIGLHSLNAYVPLQYSCVVCGHDFDSKAVVSSHLSDHKVGSMYQCDLCPFLTMQLKKLIQHRRMHTGEKPHLCPHCGYRAARRDNLRSHVRRLHDVANIFEDTFVPGDTPTCSYDNPLFL